MKLPFYKYQATGNDFVIINQMMIPYLSNPDQELVARLCDRRFGIGADGLMILTSSDIADFKMIYYNSDGGLSTMCGNGGRSIAHLAHSMKLFKDNCSFEAVDGLHDASYLSEDMIALKMNDVTDIEVEENSYVMDTGSPHFVQSRDDVNEMNIITNAHAIRYNDVYKEAGINVNFMQPDGNKLCVRTYERGVEDETYSCGTGVTASAIAASMCYADFEKKKKIDVVTKGGNLSVSFDKTANGFENIWLTGPAMKVYDGAILL